MNLFTHVNDCEISNRTYTRTNNLRPIHLFLAIISPIALIVNCFALTVLSRPQAMRLGSMRVNLITLTIFETLLNLLIFIVMLGFLVTDPNEPQHLNQALYNLFNFVFIGGALCSRNWTITLIALARCIAVTKPMISRTINSHLFRPKWMACCTITCIVAGFVLSALRLFEQIIHICTNRNYEIKLMPNPDWRIGKDLFFTYQSALPISIVVITTMIMIIALIRHKPPTHSRNIRAKHKPSRNYTGTIVPQTSSRVLAIERDKLVDSKPLDPRNDSPQVSRKILRNEQSKSMRRSQNQSKATRIITLLAVAFILFEAPIFFCVIFESYFETVRFALVTNALKSLVVLDSCANVVIYLAMSKRFRQETISLWRNGLRTRKKTAVSHIDCTRHRTNADINDNNNDNNNDGIDNCTNNET